LKVLSAYPAFPLCQLAISLAMLFIINREPTERSVCSKASVNTHFDLTARWYNWKCRCWSAIRAPGEQRLNWTHLNPTPPYCQLIMEVLVHSLRVASVTPWPNLRTPAKRNPLRTWLPSTPPHCGKNSVLIGELCYFGVSPFLESQIWPLNRPIHMQSSQPSKRADSVCQSQRVKRIFERDLFILFSPWNLGIGIFV